MDTATEIPRKIEARIAARGCTRSHVFQSAGLSRQSFDRSMRGSRPFTTAELIGIADALGIEVHDILPDAWVAPQVMAA